MSVVLNHSSSVIKVGVLAPHTLQPALCKQLNKVIVAMIEMIGILGFCSVPPTTVKTVKTWENSSDCLSTTADLLILVILNSVFPQEYILENK